MQAIKRKARRKKGGGTQTLFFLPSPISPFPTSFLVWCDWKLFRTQVENVAQETLHVHHIIRVAKSSVPHTSLLHR